MYVYGSELALSTLTSCFTILTISFVLGDIRIGLLFLFVFISVRLFAGGFHASTYVRCFITSNLVYLCAFVCIRTLCTTNTLTIQIILLIISCILITLKGPIKNLHHPLSEKVYSKNRAILRVVVPLEACCGLGLCLLTYDIIWLSSVAVSLFAVAVMMLFPLLSQWKGGAVS